MLFLKKILKLSNKTMSIIQKIGVHIGWHIYYNNYEDYYDWKDQVLYVLGIFILHRQIKNNRVTFTKKTGFALYLTKFISIVNILIIIYLSNIYGQMRFRKNASRYELITGFMYIVIGIAVEVILVISPSFANYYEKLKELHNATDQLLKQLYLKMDYSPIIVLGIVLQILVYCFLFVLICFGVYNIINADNKFIEFFEYLIIIVIVFCFFFVIVQHAGNILLCVIRGWMIIEFLRETIQNEFDSDDSCTEDDIMEKCLYRNRSTNSMYQIIIDICNKQDEIAKTTFNFTALPILICVCIYGTGTALIIYFYIYESMILYKVFAAFLLATLGLTIMTIIGQLFKWQAAETIGILSDWTVCYLDEEMIQSRISLLLQTIHRKVDEQYDGIIKVNNSLWPLIFELTMSVLVFLIQTYGAGN